MNTNTLVKFSNIHQARRGTMVALALLAFPAILFLFSSCAGRQTAAGESHPNGYLHYAQLLKIEPSDSFTICEVMDAWHSGRVKQRYILVPRSDRMPQKHPDGTIVRTPLCHAVVFSGVHASLLCDLGATERIGGLCDLIYIMRPELHKAVSRGTIANMGSSNQPDLEKIVSRHTDALLVSPFENATYGAIEKLNIPIVECVDYMEATPLGRAEWMRFFGLLFGCKAAADSLFSSVETNYTTLAATVQKTKSRPSLLIDRKQGSIWYVPGGQSYLGTMFKDAGARYCFADHKESGSVSLSFETVYQKAHDADLWLIKDGSATDLTYNQMVQDFAPYQEFRAFRQHHLWYCNTFKVPYFEEAPFHPDLLLKDYIKVVHPELLPNYTTRYFHPMK